MPDQYYQDKLDKRIRRVQEAVSNVTQFANWLENRVQKEVNDKLNGNLDNATLRQIMELFINKNHTPNIAPFVVLDSGNQALVHNNASQNYINDLTNFKNTNQENFVIITNVDDATIENWARMSINDVLENQVLKGKIQSKLGTNDLTNFRNIIISNFRDLYIDLQTN